MVDEVRWMKLKSTQVDPENKNVKAVTGDLNANAPKDKMGDFSKGPREFSLTNRPDNFYGEFKSKVDETAIRQKLEGKNIYEVTIKNSGGLITPVIIEWTFKDGSKEIERIPAEVWRLNEVEVKKIFVKEKEVTGMVIDPQFETGDVNTSDNVFPKKPAVSKFDQFKKN